MGPKGPANAKQRGLHVESVRPCISRNFWGDCQLLQVVEQRKSILFIRRMT